MRILHARTCADLWGFAQTQGVDAQTYGDLLRLRSGCADLWGFAQT